MKFSLIYSPIVIYGEYVRILKVFSDDLLQIKEKDATDEEVMEATQLAQCDEFVKKLPQGYDTLIGENRERLSGGKRLNSVKS